VIDTAHARRGITVGAVRALLDGAVDYAGLFPPAALPMADAVRAYDEYRRDPHSWALGRFVVPVTRLDEFAANAAPQADRGAPWRLSALGGATDKDVIETFNAHHPGVARIDTLEAKASTIGEIGALASSLARPATDAAPFFIYVEVPVSPDPEPLLRTIGINGLRAKVRTGGVTADAFPTSADLARFLAVCAAHGVIFKATAGLHHALRGEYRLTYEPGSAKGLMYGFLNLLLASLYLRAGLAESDVVALLEERDAHAIGFDGDDIVWHGHRLHADFVREMRTQFATSFGSCSFAEPVHELGAMGLL
jgi:hypothetical protein